MDGRRALAAAGALAVGAAGAFLCAWLRAPLPWMIGPLLALAIVQFSGASLEAPPLGREAGQLTIGAALGLYFTPEVARTVLSHWPALVLAAFGVLFVGFAAAAVLRRLSGVDFATAFFASAIGGAQEMVNLAERHRALIDRVAIAHSLRLLIVVTGVPVGLTLWGGTGSDDWRPVLVRFDAAGLAALGAVALAAALLARRLAVPNAFTMGPLLASIALTAAGVSLSSMPSWLTNAAQLLLACNLGVRFQQSFLREAPRFVASVLASVAFMLLLAAALAALLAWWSGMPIATLLLACAPGGIAEMAITAKVLQVGVAFVTAAHVLRFVVVMVFTEPAFVRLRGRARA